MTAKFNSIRIVSRIHGYIYRISNGRAGRRLGTVKFLLLTTIGRRSGKKRRVPLTAISFGEKYILVASFGGSPFHPAWLLNIRKNPVVQIRIETKVEQATASIVGITDSRYEEMWGKAVFAYAGYDDYRKATSRNIPIVLITPIKS